MSYRTQDSSAAKRALVLSAGGPVGRAWQAGLVSTLATEGTGLHSSELILGTSAGAIVGAQLAAGLDLAVASPQPTQYTSATKPSADVVQLFKTMARAAQSSSPEIELQTMGRMALDASTVSEEQSIHRLEILTKRDWPSNLRVTAVNALTGGGPFGTVGRAFPWRSALPPVARYPGFGRPSRSTENAI